MIRRLALLWLLLLAPFARAQETADETRDRTFLSGLIEDNLSSVSREVRIDGFSGALSSQATIRRLTIADQDGVWLIAEDLVLDWNRAALFGGALDVNRLGAGRIAILRQPLPDPAPPSPEAQPFTVPTLPISVRLGALDIGRIELGAPLLGEAMVLNLTGSAQLAGGNGVANVLAERIDGQAGRFAINGGYANETGILSLLADLTEAEDGLVARLLDLPGRPSLRLRLNGTGPITNYTARTTLETAGERRLTGTFGLVAEDATDAASAALAFRLNVRGDVTPLLPADYAPFFGPDAQVAVQGRRLADGTLSLSALDIDASALTLRGAAEVAPDGWPRLLRLDGVIGQANGPPILLPGAGGETSVRQAVLAVSYDQALGEDWTGRFDLTDLATPIVTIPAITLAGGGTIRPATDGAPGAFGAALDYAARGMAFADAGLGQAIGPEATGSLRLSRQDNGPVEVTQLTLAGPGITADIQGQIGGGGAALQTRGSVLLTADRLDRFALLTGLDLTGAANLLIVADLAPLDGAFEVVLTGETADLALGVPSADPYLDGPGRISATLIRDSAGLRAEGVRVETRDIRATATATVTSGASSARFDLDITDAGMALPGLTGPVRLTGTVDRDASLATRIVASAALPGVEAVFMADIAPPEAGGAITAQAEVLAADLAAFRDLSGLALSGGARLNGTGSLDPATGLYSVALSGGTVDLGLGLEQIDPLLAGPGRIAAQIASQPGGGLVAEGIEVATEALSLTGGAQLDATGLAAEFTAGLDDLGRFLPALPGPVTIAGDIARAPDGVITLDTTTRLPAGQVAVAGTLSADPVPLFAGRLAAILDDLAPLSALAGLPLGGAATLRATGEVALDLGLIALDVTGTTQNLRSGIAPVDAVLAGQGQLALRLTGSGPDQLRAEAITLITPALTASGRVARDGGGGEATLDVALSDLGLLVAGLQGAGRLAGTLALAESGALRLDLTASGPGALQASVGADLDTTAAPPLASGTASLAIGDLRPWGALAGQRLSGGVSAALTGALALDASRFDLRVDARARALDPGVPELALLLAGEGTLSGRLTRPETGGLVIEDARLRFPNLSANLALTGAGSTGQAQFDVRLSDIGLFAPEFSGPVTAEGTARRGAGGVWTLDTAATGPGGVAASVRGTVTEALRLGLQISGTAPLALANGFIEPRRLAGTAGFDLRIDGAAEIGAISGNVRLTDGRLSAPTFRQALTDLTGTVALRGGRATVDLSSRLDTGGTIGLGGSLGLSAPYAGDLRIALAGLVLRDPALYETTADGTLTLAGPLAGGARIDGLITLGPTELQVPTSGVSALGPLPPVIHVNPSATVLATLARAGLTAAGTEAAAAGGGDGAAYALDLTIRAPSRVFIRGRGLDAELGGELRLGGTTANIIPAGEFGLIRGRLDILQQRFVLTEGSATLQGDFDPVLRLVARTEARTGTEIDIIVEGQASEPSVIFVSRPELPQDEVLAQLIFGRDLATITPLQAVQLAAAVGTLAGRGGGGIIAGLRQGAGLADFDIGQDAAGNTALRAGTYLGDNLYTDVTISAEETAINLNLDITEDITATGTVSTSGETSIGIFFERDY